MAALKRINAHNAPQIVKYTLEYQVLRARWDRSGGRNLTTREAIDAPSNYVRVQDFGVS